MRGIVGISVAGVSAAVGGARVLLSFPMMAKPRVWWWELNFEDLVSRRRLGECR